jgi:predicted transposase YdaD
MISNPHDALFKSVFGQPEHARGALRAIVPAALAEALDWSTLALQPGSFVDAALTHQHTDLLYAAVWRAGGEALGRWMDVAGQVARAPHGLEALAQVMRYILEVNEHVEPEELQGLLQRDLGPDAKDAIMTAGQRLIEQGRQQGIEQGRQRFQEMLLRLLRQRFGNEVDAQVVQRVATASFEQIEAWSTRVLSATTLAELFAD